MGSKWWMKPPESWSSQFRILFWLKQKRLWPHQVCGASRFPSRILFFIWKKKVLTSHKFCRSANNRGLIRFWNIVEKFYVTQRMPFARSRKRIGRLLGSIKPLKPPLRSERAFQNVRFAFCVVNVLSLNPKATVFRRCLGFRGAIKEEPWSFQLIRGSVYTMVQSADHFEKIWHQRVKSW